MDNNKKEKPESWKVKKSVEDWKKGRPKPYDREGEKNKDLTTKKEDREKCEQTKGAACSSKRDNEIVGQPAILAEFTQNSGSNRIVIQGSQFVYEHQDLPTIDDPSEQEEFDRETDELLEVMQHVDGDYGYEPNNFYQQEQPREQPPSQEPENPPPFRGRRLSVWDKLKDFDKELKEQAEARDRRDRERREREEEEEEEAEANQANRAIQ